jgi:hypothetical protein
VLGKAQPGDGELDTIEQELALLQQKGRADAFCLYLYGLVLIDR